MKFILTLALALVLAGGCSFGGSKQREHARPLDGKDAGEYLLVQRDGTKSDLRYRLVQGERWKFEHQVADGTWADATCHGDCLLEPTSADQAARFMRDKVPGGQFASCVHNASYAVCRVAGSRGPRSYAYVSLGTGVPIAFDLERVADAAPSS